MEIGDLTRLAPQGWQCPVCGRVYSPTWPWCTVCGNPMETTVSNGTVPAHEGIVRKIMVGDMPETMKQQTTGGK